MKTRIRYATLTDYPAIQALQRAFSNQIGFVTRQALRDYIAARSIRIATQNDRPIGYLLGRLSLSWQPLLAQIIQIAVDPGHARTHVATQLLATFVKHTQATHKVGIQAICREDLAANRFWQARGFKPICHLTPNNARKKALIVWRLPLVTKLPIWFASPPRRAGTHGRRPTPATRKGIPHHGHNPARWTLPNANPTQRSNTARRGRKS